MVAAKASSKESSSRALTNIRTLSPELGNSIGCVIASGTTIEGQMNTTENVRLDGRLKGSLACQKRLVVGQKGIVEGSVAALEADISGRVEGDVQVEGLLILRASAKIGGTIKTKAIQIEMGATYDGDCKIG
ncbi:MAG: polymer-forming cytoskeletal protein [Bacteroidota bacterium]